jgi:hypothetical protein
MDRLLTNGEDDVYIAARYLIFFDAAQRLADDGDAALVVRLPAQSAIGAKCHPGDGTIPSPGTTVSIWAESKGRGSTCGSAK